MKVRCTVSHTIVTSAAVQQCRTVRHSRRRHSDGRFDQSSPEPPKASARSGRSVGDMGAPHAGATVHVKLFEDVTNSSRTDHLRGAKAPAAPVSSRSRPPSTGQRDIRVEVHQQRQAAQAALRQRTNAAVPHYARPCGMHGAGMMHGMRPQTAPSQRHHTKGPPGYAGSSRPSQRGGEYAARTAQAERAYLAPTKPPTADPYALGHNPRLGEVEKDLLHRQALLRRLMRDPRHTGYGMQAGPPASKERPGTAQSAFGGCSGGPEMYRHEKVRAARRTAPLPRHAYTHRTDPRRVRSPRSLAPRPPPPGHRCWGRAPSGWCRSCARC